MSSIINAYIDLSKITKSEIKEGKNGQKFYNFQLFVNDETRYDNNVSIAENQSMEERQNKEPKHYIGNGKVVWTDGKIVQAEKKQEQSQQAPPQESDNGDLPF